MRNGAVVLAVLSLVVAVLLQFRPIDDLDICWQIKLGQLALESKSLIQFDPFTFTHHGDPVPTIGWLAQIWFAVLFDIGRWHAIQLFCVLLFVMTLAITGRLAITQSLDRAQPLSMFSLACAYAMTTLSAETNTSLRPQLIGLLCFAIVISLYHSHAKLRIKLLAIIPCLLVWQNTHPSVVVGAVALLPILAVKCIAWLRGRGRVPWREFVILVVVASSQFATPMGTAIVESSTRNLEISRDVLQVSEWMPAWTLTDPKALICFWFTLGITVVLVAKLRLRLQLVDFLLCLIMSALALYAARFVLFWSVAMLPIWARWIQDAKPKGFLEYDAKRNNMPRRKALTIILVGAAVAILIPVIARPLLQRSMFDRIMPWNAVRQLAAHKPSGRIYNFREFGGLLILEGHPDWQVLIDGRLYLFDRSEWHAYEQAAAGQIPLDQIMLEHRPDAFMLRPSYHRGLIALLDDDSRWQAVYRDEISVVYVPSS